MLQDTLRSAVYRSLTKPAPVNMEIGNQSVGYGGKIKYKHSKPTKVNTPPGRRTGSPQSFMEEEEEEEEEKGNGSGQKNHLQLFHASEGARELAQMIDSLSKAPNLDGRSKYIAKDLLRGAQDLQSSLAMLTKLQEASKSVSRSKVKGRHEVVEEEVGMQRTARSKRFALQETRHSVDQSMLKPKRRSKIEGDEIGLEEIRGSRRFGLQEPSHSVDGSARSFLGEHKKMSLKQRPEFMEKDISAGGIMDFKRFGSRKSRFSVDGSSRYGVEEMKMMSQLKFKQRFEYIEEEIGVEDMTGSKRVGKQKPRFSERSFGSGFKLKQRSEYVEEEFDVEETMPSKRFGSQEPRLSVDSVQELRRAIKEGLSRQNLLPQSSDDSQSQSLRSPKSHRPQKFKERGYERKEKLSGPSPAALQPKQAKGPNVIAKLMGLGEVPSATVPTSKREEERKKGLIMPRPAFDIDDRPNARKMQVVETPNPTQKSLHEIIAALQFKGLLKSGRGEDFRAKSRPFDASQPKMCSRSFNREDDVPPIVIMKPLYLPHWEREGQKSLLLDKISADEEINSSVNLIGETVDSDHRQMVAKASKRGEMKSTEEASAEVSQKANTLTTVAQKLQRKRASKSSKRTDEGQQLLLEVKKEEKEDMKKKRVPVSEANTTYYTPPANPEKQVSASKIEVSQIKPESKNSTSVAKEKKTSASKSIRKSTDTKIDDNHFKDGKRNNSQEGKDSFSKNTTSTVHDLPEGAYTEAKPCIQDGKQGNLCEMMQKTIQGGKMPEFASEAIRLPHKKTTTRIASEVEEDLMCLLLSSRSFINHAKELFLIDAHQPVHYKRKGIGEDVMKNAKLYLDCGKELMVRRSNQHEAFSNRMRRASSCTLNAFPSLSQLAEEISSIIEVLTSYSKIDDNATSEDNLYLRLERDLRCKEMMSSANWDIGWADWVCDASRAVGELQEFILDSLIAEVAQDMVWL